MKLCLEATLALIRWIILFAILQCAIEAGQNPRSPCNNKELLLDCGNECPMSCADVASPCTNDCMSASGCVCKDGRVRDARGKCVPTRRCRQRDTTDPCAKVRCRRRFECVPRPTDCLVPPCPVVGQCEPIGAGRITDQPRTSTSATQSTFLSTGGTSSTVGAIEVTTPQSTSRFFDSTTGSQSPRVSSRSTGPTESTTSLSGSTGKTNGRSSSTTAQTTGLSGSSATTIGRTESSTSAAPFTSPTTSGSWSWSAATPWWSMYPTGGPMSTDYYDYYTDYSSHTSSAWYSWYNTRTTPTPCHMSTDNPCLSNPCADTLVCRTYRTVYCMSADECCHYVCVDTSDPCHSNPCPRRSHCIIAQRHCADGTDCDSSTYQCVPDPPRVDACASQPCAESEDCVRVRGATGDCASGRCGGSNDGYECRQRRVCGPRALEPLRNADNSSVDCSQCADSAHFCLPLDGANVCCPKNDSDPSQLSVRIGRRLRENVNRGDVLSDIIADVAFENLGASLNDGTAVLAPFATIYVQAQLSDGLRVDVDREAHYAACCRPPTLSSCMLSGGLIQLPTEAEATTTLDLQGIAFECETGSLPTGPATVVIDVDPFQVHNGRCTVATIDINFEGMEIKQNSSEGGCVVVPDYDTMGNAAFILQGGSAVRFNPLTDGAPSFERVDDLKSEVVVAKFAMLRKYVMQTMENSDVCAFLSTESRFEMDESFLETSLYDAVAREWADEMNDILMKQANLTSFALHADQCSNKREYFHAAQHSSCTYQRALAALVSVGYLQQSDGDEPANKHREKNHGVGRLYRSGDDASTPADRPANLTAEQVCVDVLIRKFLLDTAFQKPMHHNQLKHGDRRGHAGDTRMDERGEHQWKARGADGGGRRGNGHGGRRGDRGGRASERGDGRDRCDGDTMRWLKESVQAVDGAAPSCERRMPQFFWTIHANTIYQGYKASGSGQFVWQRRAVCECADDTCGCGGGDRWWRGGHGRRGHGRGSEYSHHGSSAGSDYSHYYYPYSYGSGYDGSGYDYYYYFCTEYYDPEYCNSEWENYGYVNESGGDDTGDWFDEWFGSYGSGTEGSGNHGGDMNIAVGELHPDTAQEKNGGRSLVEVFDLI